MTDPDLLADLQELMVQQPNPTQVDSARMAAAAMAAKGLAETLALLYKQRSNILEHFVWDRGSPLTGAVIERKESIARAEADGDKESAAAQRRSLADGLESFGLTKIDAEIEDVKQLIRDLCR